MNTRNTPKRASAAFTRVELIVTIAVVLVLALLAVPATGYLKERSVRRACSQNVAKLVSALRGYANDHEGLLPDCTRKNPDFYGPVWPWEIHTNLTAALEQYGASRKHYYCPANPTMNDDAHWNFGQINRSKVRVTGYLMLLNGTREVQHELRRTNLLGALGKPPSQTELVADVVASQMGNYIEIRGLLKDRSNHVKGTMPLGGNIGFEDGHVEWRNFKDMNHQIRGAAVWDF